VHNPLPRVLAVLILILLVAVGYYRQRSQRTEAALATANDAATHAAAEAAGYLDAREATSRELAKLRAAMSTTPPPTTLKPAIITRTVTREVMVEVPIDRPVTTTIEVPSDCPASPPTTSMGVSATSTVDLSLTPLGHVMHRSTTSVHLRTPTWSRIVDLPTDDASTTVHLSDDISTALRDYASHPPRFALAPRPARYWRTGWTAGIAATYNPFATSTATVGVGVMYGVQF